ncbi:MAG: aryl-sulfate sulfotransferase [Acidobacteria bacterium]|nr:aryl-sulfate sulfotransferase [Acidobacteriota bacterium]
MAEAALNVQLSTTSGPNLPVGTRLQFQASVTPPTSGLWYRFRVKPAGGSFSVIKDFDPYSNGAFAWAPMEEGAWDIEVTAKNPSNQDTGAATVTYNVVSQITAGAPVVSSVSTNTLMALFSVPACTAGNVSVTFWPTANAADVTSTRSLPCKPGKSLNFLIAGMLPSTEYTMRHRTVSGWTTTNGPSLTFTTGALPGGITNSSVPSPANPATSQLDKVVLEVGLVPAQCIARNLSGVPIWYYNTAANGPLFYCLRPVLGGTMLLIPQPSPSLTQLIIQEVDLAGNLLRETNAQRVSEQLVAMGKQPITGIHHDATRLPNGNTAMIVSREKVVGTRRMVGDGIVVLDRDFQVLWSFDTFEKLDTNRAAVAGELCTGSGQGGCPPFSLLAPTEDWTHANSVSYTDDGNLIMSLRHQDWVIKIRYANGAGNGDVIWKLGPQGDITLTNPGVSSFPFQSHQHYAIQKGNRLWLYDNGNTRVGLLGGNSRGQVYVLNEATKTATLELNADLGFYTAALGSAQRLANGNYAFGGGDFVNTLGKHIEVVPNPLPAGTLNYISQVGNIWYRALRMRDMYTYLD